MCVSRFQLYISITIHGNKRHISTFSYQVFDGMWKQCDKSFYHVLGDICVSYKVQKTECELTCYSLSNYFINELLTLSTVLAGSYNGIFQLYCCKHVDFCY